MLKEREKIGNQTTFDEKDPFTDPIDDPAENLDQYGVWVKSGPEPVEEDVFETQEEYELKDLPDTTSLELTSEEEELLGSLETEEAAPAATTKSDEPDQTGLEDINIEEEALDLDFGELPELETPQYAVSSKTEETEEFSLEPMENLEGDTLPTAEEGLEPLEMEELEQEEELPELEIEEPVPSEESATATLSAIEEVLEPESTLQTETPVSFSDVEAVAREMGEVSSPLPMDILTKIEEELAEIKNELAELKQELSVLRSVPTAPSEEAPEKITSVPAEAESSGFFEEDEDETIALTGDELDNILNTADITEEKGEPDIYPEDIELKPLTEEAPTESFIPVTTPEEQAIIEEYNKELDQFTSTEMPFEAEDRIDQEAVETLPEDLLEKEDLFITEEKPEPEPLHTESLLMEKPAPQEVPNLTDLVPEEEPLEEIEAEEKPEEIPLAEEPEGVVEFDLESLEEMAEEEKPGDFESNEAVVAPEKEAAFEEELEEMEINLPETEEEKVEEASELEAQPYPLAEEVSPIEELETLETEETPVVPLEEEVPILHIPTTEEKPEPQPSAARMTPTEEAPNLAEGLPEPLREEIKSVLQYMDQLLEALPEEKIQEFARSEHFEVYRRLFEELGLE
jgi:hypothetical protein